MRNNNRNECGFSLSLMRCIEQELFTPGVPAHVSSHRRGESPSTIIAVQTRVQAEIPVLSALPTKKKNKRKQYAKSHATEESSKTTARVLYLVSEGGLDADEDVAELAPEHEEVLAVRVEVAGSLAPVLDEVPGVGGELLVLLDRHAVLHVHLGGVDPDQTSDMNRDRQGQRSYSKDKKEVERLRACERAHATTAKYTPFSTTRDVVRTALLPQTMPKGLQLRLTSSTLCEAVRSVEEKRYICGSSQQC